MKTSLHNKLDVENKNMKQNVRFLKFVLTFLLVCDIINTVDHGYEKGGGSI